MYPKILAIATVTILLFLFLFGWLNANIDSYFYYAFGEYVRTGIYPFIKPFIYTKPTTISPPLYGLFFSITQNIPHADILLHGLQLIFLAATSYILYRMLRWHTQKTPAVITSCLFALWPTNIIYASQVMTENPSQFAVALWLYFVLRGTRNHDPRIIASSFLVAAVATLLKYNLGIFIPISALLLFSYRKKLRGKDYFFPLFSAGILIAWMFINYRITGTFGLYDTRGTQLYNQFIAQTKILPPDNHPSILRMRKLLPPGTDIAVPYWDIQQKLSVSLDGNWQKIDQTLFDVAWASVTLHPWQYLVHSMVNYASIHTDHVPHWRNIGNMGIQGFMGNDTPFCGNLGSVTTCAPIIHTPTSFTIWNAYIQLEMKFFELLATPTFFLIILPSLIVSLFRKNNLSRIYATIYLAATIPIALTIHPDPRYIVPFYPLIVLIVTISITRLKKIWHLFLLTKTLYSYTTKRHEHK